MLDTAEKLPILNYQYVAHHGDGRYTVRTFAITAGKPSTATLIREVPANMRDIAQATLDDKIVEIGELVA